MKDNRKRFLMYADYSDYFDMTENEQLGELIKQFFRYAAGKDADTSRFTQGMQFLYTMLKNNFDRDTAAYKSVCAVNAETARKREQKRRDNASSGEPSFVVSEVEQRTYDIYRKLQ